MAQGPAFESAKSLTSENASKPARLEKLQSNHEQFMDVAASLMMPVPRPA
ncbi:MAG: hypothetical protein IV105_23825 [Rhizobacter sp.]|nr:hypothetical protein [Rhizobacter sp.]